MWTIAVVSALAGRVAFAQAPGVPIERQGPVAHHKEWLKQAAALRDAGKLLDVAHVRDAVAAPTPAELELPPPRTQTLSGREIAAVARRAAVRVGWYARFKNSERWELDLADGYAITADGVVATCEHCLRSKGVKEGYLVAVDAAGTVLPVTGVLAVNRVLDACLVRVAGGDFAPLPLSDDVAPGDPAYCYSDPLDHSGYFTQGIVNRFYWRRGKRGSDTTLGGLQYLRLNVSTDWAPGSSGAAVLDAAGNAIGHVARILPLTMDHVEPSEAEAAEDAAETPHKHRHEQAGPTLMVVHEAIPARSVKALALGGRVTPSAAPTTANKPEPSKPRDAAPTLSIGDPAPALTVSKWVQGEPVEKLEKDTAYVVEFWATWCGPCVVSIPHLNELHEKFADRGLVVIGQDCWERDTDKVPAFLEKMGDKMTYRVALDDTSTVERGAMAQNWMQAAGQNGIPTAFVVDKAGRIAWIGHPMELNDEILSAVLAGTYDIEEAKRDFAARRRMQQVLQAKFRPFVQALRDKEFDRAEQLLEEMEAALPESRRTLADNWRLDLVIRKGDSAGAEALAEKLAAADKVTGQQLNQVAWKLVISDLKDLNFALLERLARRGVELTPEDNRSAVLDTLARVLYRQNKKEEAIATQKQAVELCPEGPQKKQMEDTLAAYERGELPPADE